MSNSDCKLCYGTLWLWFSPTWKDGALSAVSRPFDRGAWRLAGELAISAALAAGSLKPCSCNPKRIPPWKATDKKEAGEAASEKGGANGVPF